jgi:predicted aminopeptidase
VEEWLRAKSISPRLESMLKLSQSVLSFAEEDLGMNVGRNYRRYIELSRPWVSQIVMAAYRDRLESRLFQYPIVGSLPYRGYFNEADAKNLEERLKGEGFDTYRRPVSAFSSLGWFPDPLLSTMMRDEAHLIELLFHELTHSTFFFAGQADFNEAFASWMGFRAALLFLDSPRAALHFDETRRQELRRELQRDHAFQLKLARFVSEQLKLGRAGNFEREAFYTRLKSALTKDPELASFAARDWNNAFLLSLGTYYERVPSIEAKYEKSIDHWMRELKKVKDLAHMEQVSHLKTKFEIGHGHANALVAHFRAGQK